LRAFAALRVLCGKRLLKELTAKSAKNATITQRVELWKLWRMADDSISARHCIPFIAFIAYVRPEQSKTASTNYRHINPKRVAPGDASALRLNHPFNRLTQGSRNDNPGL
jgi:hypothetical protein